MVAAEPLVQDPVAIDWGPDGRLWVAEMADYPVGVDNNGTPGGRIRVLEDTNGDGELDKSTVFLDQLPFPNGVMVWKDGVLITAAPNILFARDSDDDGVADEVTALFEGFAEANQQLRVNGLRYGLDHQIYCAAGFPGFNPDKDSEVHSTKSGKRTPLGSRDFCFDFDSGELIPQTGPSQFGRSRDDWGEWFGCSNSFPLWHCVLEDRYLVRNPYVKYPEPIRQLILPQNPRVYAVSAPDSLYQNHPGRFTSACSAMIYRDRLLFDNHDDSGSATRHAFVCEPANNLVHHAVLRDAGVSFAASRETDEEKSEFLASDDRWFRPVMVRTGPDGALWVVDMCRRSIEHPQYVMPHASQDLTKIMRLGDEYGRIYRVVREDKPTRPIENLQTASLERLVALLESPNGPTRDGAQRKLIESADPRVDVCLSSLLSHSESSLARLHALCILHRRGSLSNDLMVRALRDGDSRVQSWAIRFAESRQSLDANVLRAILALCDDPHPRLKRQLICSLGQIAAPESAEALARIAVATPNDTYLQACILSSVNADNIGQVLDNIFKRGESRPISFQLVGQLLAVAIGVGADSEVDHALGQIVNSPDGASFEPWRLHVVAEFLDLMERGSARENPHKLNLVDAMRRCAGAIESARNAIATEVQDESTLLAAIRLVGRQPEQASNDVSHLRALLAPHKSLAVQTAALDRLIRIDNDLVFQAIMHEWRSQRPTMRVKSMDAVLRRPRWASALLSMIEDGSLTKEDLGTSNLLRLSTVADKGIQTRATKLLGSQPNEGVAEYADDVLMHDASSADSARGAEIFKKHCASCHVLENKGAHVGPNLASLSDRSAPAILDAILSPNRSVDPRYQSYSVVTSDGLVYSGVLAAETASGITLVCQDGKSVQFLRTELETLRNNGVSLMPEGLHKLMTPKEMADVVKYVASVEPERRVFPGNQPRRVTPDENGVLRLSAATCEIHGPSLSFAEEYENLGNWRTVDDRAIWDVTVGVTADYDVVLYSACEKSHAGKSFLLEAEAMFLRGEVPDSHIWVSYHQKHVGSIRLKEGNQRIVFRAADEGAGDFIHLKEIVLTPIERK